MGLWDQGDQAFDQPGKIKLLSKNIVFGSKISFLSQVLECDKWNHGIQWIIRWPGNFCQFFFALCLPVLCEQIKQKSWWPMWCEHNYKFNYLSAYYYTNKWPIPVNQ